MLILIATPIGNLMDLSERAKKALCSCELLLCEDTRHTGQLFQLAGISAPRMKSLHKFNEAQKEDEILEILRRGVDVGLVSDAGTPGIADPGARLVDRCHAEGIRVSIVPGPCAFVAAYALSGFAEECVQFLGFLPKTAGEKKKVFDEIGAYRGVSVVYESPHRLKETLREVNREWKVVLVRELTKMHEEVLRATVEDLLKILEDREIKGECALVFSPKRAQIPPPEELLREVLKIRESFSCPVKEAIEVVARTYGVSQKELYRLVVTKRNADSDTLLP